MSIIAMSIIEKATEFSRDFEFSAFRKYEEEDLVRSLMLGKTLDFIHQKIGETAEAIDDNNRAGIINGVGDIAFIALNGIYKEFRTAGDDHDQAFKKTVLVMNRICNANLAKRHPDGSIIYANGKVQKPEGWQPPNYDDLL